MSICNGQQSKPKPRIAFVTQEYYPSSRGGAGISGRLLVDALRRRGIWIDVYVPRAPCATTREEPGTFYFNKSPTENLLTLNSDVLTGLRGRLKGYDVIHVYNVVHLPGVLLAYRSKPVLATLNNHTWSCTDVVRRLRTHCDRCSYLRALRCTLQRKDMGKIKGLARYGIEIAGRFIAKRAQLFTTQTYSMKRCFVASGFPEQRIEVVPNLLDPAFRVTDKGLDQGRLRRIAFVGRLSPEKGAGTLLEAFAHLPPDLRDECQLVFYGKGPEEESLKNRANRLELKNVHFHYVEYEDLPHIYGSVDLLVSPSEWHEPFSRTWLEAMASATPVLSSDTPGAREVLNDCAVYFEPGNIGDLQRQLMYVIGNSDLRMALVERGLRISEKFGPDKIARQYETLYRTLMDEYPGPGRRTDCEP
jgi:glycosyltransferase involved in cell wall biosynthesis